MTKPTKPRQIALLVELPAGLGNAQLPALRLLLKTLIRSYGIRYLSVLPPSETRTFGSMAASIEAQATYQRSTDQ